MQWFSVERRYRVTDTIYVQADSAQDAEAKVRDGEYDYVTDTETLPGRSFVKASRRKGVPRWVWEEMGYPDDVDIISPT